MANNPTSPREFRPGQTLFNEGEPSDSLYLITQGTVGIRKRKGTGQVEIARIYANEVLGELSFFDRLPRSGSAVALTEVKATQIPFEALERALSGMPDYFRTIVGSLAERLRKANDQIRKLQKDAVPEDSPDLASPEVSATDILAMTADSKPDNGDG